jgi:hypothetical protein
VTMKQVSDLIRTFFEDFERASNTFEQDLLASLFSDPYMAADPHGRIHVVKKDDLLAGITKRQALFHSLGLQFVKIVPLEETCLDTHYVMVKAHTSMRFEKTSAQPIDMSNDSIYILFIQDDSPQIVFNLTHEDVLKMMQEHGLFPEKP